MSQDGLDPPLEMDTLPIHPSSTGKSPAPNKLAQRDYAVGICLLLSVVFLWTASNFVTQVQSFEPSLLRTVTTRVLEIRTCSLEDMRNLSCLYRLFFDARNILAHATQHHLPHNELVFTVPSTVSNKGLCSTVSWGLRPTGRNKVSECPYRFV